ncbi:hypothetical protein SDC9_212293 [bioreactor metagenome]|uniref:Uncharacterized protein n=1 Tax=bioreactor metagenome TaxID=1076179 RepID=A0A645JLH5_9ZZZZ
MLITLIISSVIIVLNGIFFAATTVLIRCISSGLLNSSRLMENLYINTDVRIAKNAAIIYTFFILKSSLINQANTVTSKINSAGFASDRRYVCSDISAVYLGLICTSFQNKCGESYDPDCSCVYSFIYRDDDDSRASEYKMRSVASSVAFKMCA